MSGSWEQAGHKNKKELGMSRSKELVGVTYEQAIVRNECVLQPVDNQSYSGNMAVLRKIVSRIHTHYSKQHTAAQSARCTWLQHVGTLDSICEIMLLVSIALIFTSSRNKPDL